MAGTSAHCDNETPAMRRFHVMNLRHLAFGNVEHRLVSPPKIEVSQKIEISIAMLRFTPNRDASMHGLARGLNPADHIFVCACR